MEYVRRKLKAGFTIIEVSIVIAVIAILVSVLVPVFTSLISSANLSNDSVTVKYINDALSTDEAIDGKPLNVIDAFEILYKSGFTADNFTLSDGNRLVYDSNSNSMLIYNSDFTSVLYPEKISAATVKTASYKTDNHSNLCVIGTENIEDAVTAGITDFYLYSTESVIELETTSQITLWLYTEAEDVQINAEQAVVYHNKTTSECLSKGYISLSDNSYNFMDSYSTADADSSEEYSDAEDSSAETSEIQPHEHEYIESVIKKEANCYEEGIEWIYCRCGEYIIATIGKLEHEYGEWQTETEATCSECGKKYKVCSGCGDVIYETIEQLEHEYVATNVESTVDERGYTTYTCTLCNDSYCNNYTDYRYTEELVFEKATDSNGDSYYIVTGISDTPIITDIYIPSYYKAADDSDYIPVKEIAASAFSNNDNIVNVTIGCTVETIGDSAFYECSALKKVNIPRNLTTFGKECFARCDYLSEIYYEAISASTLKEDTFLQAGYSSKNLTVYISKDVQKIPKNLFYTVVTNPKIISYQACVVSIIFEEGSICTEIGNYALGNLICLKTMVLPSSIAKIYDYSIYDSEGANVYFMGTEEEWKSNVLSSQTFVSVANIYYYSETYKDGCWYYDDDSKITIWQE